MFTCTQHNSSYKCHMSLYLDVILKVFVDIFLYFVVKFLKCLYCLDVHSLCLPLYTISILDVLLSFYL